MTGPFIAHETVLQCKKCRTTLGSDALGRLVRRCCNVGYDVLIFVGRALFQRYRTTQEVRGELAARDIRISASEVGYLGRQFITYLAISHRLATPRIRQAMERSGGYILHLDATHEGDAPALMTGMDGLSEIVLANVKIPTENADHIASFLRDIRKTYGTPAACVHDMGTGICKAVADVFPGVLDFVCHFHFLRDIGKDFLDPAYRELRNGLRKHGISSRLHALARRYREHLQQQDCNTTPIVTAIKSNGFPDDTKLLPHISTYSLALWCLQGKQSGDGYGFPFDRPLLTFAERLLELHCHLPEVLERVSATQRREFKPLFSLARVVSIIADDPQICSAVETLRWRSQVFDRLREAMRIAEPGGSKALNDDGTAEAINTIREGVRLFRLELDEDPRLATDPLSRNMAKQIDKYDEKLFADPIETMTPNGPVTIYPQRTNNILEQFFRGVRRTHRRKSGNNSLHRVLQNMLADTPLIKNLDNPAYMKVLLGGRENLESLFAELGTMMPKSSAESKNQNDRLLPGFRAIIKIPTLLEDMVRLIAHVTWQPEKSN